MSATPLEQLHAERRIAQLQQAFEVHGQFGPVGGHLEFLFGLLTGRPRHVQCQGRIGADTRAISRANRGQVIETRLSTADARGFGPPHAGLLHSGDALGADTVPPVAGVSASSVARRSGGRNDGTLTPISCKNLPHAIAASPRDGMIGANPV